MIFYDHEYTIIMGGIGEIGMENVANDGDSQDLMLTTMFEKVDVDDEIIEKFNAFFNRFIADLAELSMLNERFHLVLNLLTKGLREVCECTIEQDDSKLLRLFLDWHLERLFGYDLTTQAGYDMRDKALGLLIAGDENDRRRLIILTVINQFVHTTSEKRAEFRSEALSMIANVDIVNSDDYDLDNGYTVLHIQNGRPVVTAVDESQSDGEEAPQ